MYFLLTGLLLSISSEASYAYKLKKPIVPLLAESDYEPDGWLGALAGMLLYYRIYSDEVMTSDFKSLVRELGNKGMTVGKTNGFLVFAASECRRERLRNSEFASLLITFKSIFGG